MPAKSHSIPKINPSGFGLAFLPFLSRDIPANAMTQILLHSCYIHTCCAFVNHILMFVVSWYILFTIYNLPHALWEKLCETVDN